MGNPNKCEQKCYGEGLPSSVRASWQRRLRLEESRPEIGEHPRELRLTTMSSRAEVGQMTTKAKRTRKEPCCCSPRAAESPLSFKRDTKHKIIVPPRRVSGTRSEAEAFFPCDRKPAKLSSGRRGLHHRVLPAAASASLSVRPLRACGRQLLYSGLMGSHTQRVASCGGGTQNVRVFVRPSHSVSTAGRTCRPQLAAGARHHHEVRLQASAKSPNRPFHHQSARQGRRTWELSQLACRPT